MPTKKSYHHGDLRRALLDAALATLAAGGAEALSFRTLGKRVGVDHTAAYRHFADKRALLAALAEEGFDELARDVATAAAGPGSAHARLLSVLRSYVGFALAAPHRYALMFGPRLNEDGAFPTLETAIRKVVAPIEGVVRDAGTIYPAVDVLMSLWITAHGFATMVLAKRIRVRSRAAALDYAEKLAAPQLAAWLRPAP